MNSSNKHSLYLYHSLSKEDVDVVKSVNTYYVIIYKRE